MNASSPIAAVPPEVGRPEVECLPAEIHGAEVVAGSVRLQIEYPEYEWTERGGYIAFSRTQAVFCMPGGGRFRIEHGRRVVVDARPDDRPAAWLHATVGSLVLAQQDRFALHANVIDVNGTAVALCGVRRAGKSTSSLAMTVRGHRLVTDDVTTLDVVRGAIVHRPSGRPVHVQPATARRLGLSVEHGVPLTGDPTKIALPNPATGPVRVDAIVLLRAVDRPVTGVELSLLDSARAIGAVHRHTYRRDLLDPVWSREIFTWAADIAHRVPVRLLVREADRWSVDAVCEALEVISAAPAART